MNNVLFDRATHFYEGKDYRKALVCFTECLQDTATPLAPGEMGLLYHRIGNCLTKLGNPGEAIQAYTQASADTAYKDMGAVECNLGMAYASLRDYENAVRCFNQAVSADGYATPYKAYTGMGNALMKMGKTAEAGASFREAALDEGNPDPTKALLNLGVCFMALDRPEDAVATYESALPFDMSDETRNRLYASLGQAYVACGSMAQAVDAFERAIEDKTYFLSDSASVDYQRAVGAVAQGQGGAEVTQLLPVADMSGLDIAADGSTVYEDDDYYYDDEEEQDPFFYDEPYDEDAYPGYYGAQTQGEDHFFNATDEELEQWSRGLARQDRKRRNVGLKFLVAVIIIIVLAFAGAVVAYSQGFGFPSQDTVARELFADPSAAEQNLFSHATDEQAVAAMVAPVVQDDDPEILGVNRSMTESEVYAKATTPEGGELEYRITMVRDFIGWKISNVELYFPSQN